MAGFLGVSHNAVKKWIAKKMLRCGKTVGRARFFLVEDVLEIRRLRSRDRNLGLKNYKKLSWNRDQ